MGALANIYLKAETLDTLLKTVRAKGEKGVSLTISINDEADQFGQNVASFVSQTKEESVAKKKKFYTGNGRVFWVKGEVKVAEKTNTSGQQVAANASDLDTLPF